MMNMFDNLFHGGNHHAFQADKPSKGKKEIGSTSADIDSLTGLLSSKAALRAIGEYLSGEGKNGVHALFKLDVDNIKRLNNLFGRNFGDKALQRVAGCLKYSFRETDICSRVGGDEFIVFIKNIAIDDIVRKAKQLISELTVTFRHEGNELISSVSMGIAVYRGSSSEDSLELLCTKADNALYKAKSMGKGTYAFAGELDILAASAVVTNETLSYNLRGLLDNLANGVSILHGPCIEATADQIVPVFCNKYLLDMLDISYEQFFTHMDFEHHHGMFPDDYAKTEKLFVSALETGESVKTNFRLRKGNGEYIYVSVYANCSVRADKSIDWYIVYSEAKEAEQLLRIKENRHQELRRKAISAAQNDAGYALLNITKNLCVEIHIVHEALYPIKVSGTAEEFLRGIERNISSDEIRQKLSDSINSGEFLRAGDIGVFVSETRVPLFRADGRSCWYKIIAEFSFDPENGDSELFIIFKDVDTEVRMEGIIERILDTEYEYLCLIDAHCGYITRMGDTDEDNISKETNGRVKYSDVLGKGVDHMLPAEYRKAGMEKLAFEAVIKALESNDKYTVVFPVVADSIRGDRLCRWSFEYIDSMHSTLLMTRKNVSDYLNYGFDQLTGMMTRDGFFKAVSNALSWKLDRQYHLLEIDFDGFKLINEERGYEGGNEFLRRFSVGLYELVTKLDPSACVGRFEADHFLIFISTDAQLTPESLYKQINELIIAKDSLIIRMGAYEVKDESLDIAYMCECAHFAHKACKDGYDNKIIYYSLDLRNKMLETEFLEAEMQNALDTEQFEIWFQPQVNHTAGGTLIGAEALVRWRHRQRGLISPSAFIPIFEKNGFIYRLDKYVLEHTCRYLRSLLDRGMGPLPISVNISRLDILQSDFTDTVAAIVAKYGIPRELVHLEITETALSTNAEEAIRVIKTLIDMGFFISIDDFGSGYSSLGMLRRVPAQLLKLDMHFFSDNESATRNNCIVESVIRLAKMLGMAIIAEGVENKEQADFLRAVGCNYIQGYLYSKPLPYDQFVEYIKSSAELAQLSSEDEPSVEMPTQYNLSRELYRSIISGSSDVILVVDIKNKQLLYANHAAEQYYGKGFDPIKPITCMEYCNKSHLCKDCPANTLNHEETKDILLTENQRHLKCRFTRTEWNSHDAFIFEQTDITNEMREAELSEALVRNIPAAMITFFIGSDGRPRVKYASKRACAIFEQAGVENSQLTYEDCFAIMHPDDIARMKETADNFFAKRLAAVEEFRILLKDGTVVWIELRVNPVVDSNGDWLFYGIYSDITPRKSVQARTDALIRKIPSAMTIYEIAPSGMWRIFISDRAKMMLNTSGDSNDRVDVEDIYLRIDEMDVQMVRDVINEAASKVQPFSVQFRLKGDGSTPRWVQLDAIPITNGEDSLHYYSVYTDITAQKASEQHELEGSILEIRDVLNSGLQQALRQKTTEEAIAYILRFTGQTFSGERAYIFEKNADGTDSNTYEWVAEGVTPEMDMLQNVPAEVCADWYELLKKDGIIVVPDIEQYRETNPSLYEKLAVQDIRSVIIAPIFDEKGEPTGFFGLDNPPMDSIDFYASAIKATGFFAEAALKRRNLERQLMDRS